MILFKSQFVSCCCSCFFFLDIISHSIFCGITVAPALDKGSDVLSSQFRWVLDQNELALDLSFDQNNCVL